jgi:signal transduction histidine kinase
MIKQIGICVIIMLSSFSKVGAVAPLNDSELDSLYQLAFSGLDYDINASKLESRLLIKEAKANKDYINLAYAYDVYGLALFYSNSFDSATFYADKAIDLFKLQGNDEGLSTAIFNKSVVTEYLGKYNSAIALLNKARRIDIKRGAKVENDIFYYHRLADILHSQDRIDEALVYAHRSLDAFMVDGSYHAYMESRIYLTLAWLYQDLEIYELAGNYARKAYALTLKSKELGSQISSLQILAINAKMLNNEIEAISYARNALRIALNYNETQEVLYAKAVLAKILDYFEEDNKEARQYWIEVDSVISSLGDFEKDLDITFDIYNYYKAEGNYERANVFLEDYIKVKKNLNLVDAREILSNFERDLKEIEAIAIKAQLKVEEGENMLKGSLIVGLSILFCILLIAFLISIRAKNKINKLNNSLNYSNKNLFDKELELRQSFDKLEEKYAEIKELNASKNKLLSILSHDLRQPFNQIIAVLDLIDQDILDFEERRDIVRELKISVEETSSMVNNLLQWSKSQFEGTKINPQVINLEIVAKRISLELSVLLKKKSIFLDFNIDETIYLMADETQLSSIIRNVLSNAYKFSEINSVIKIYSGFSEDGKYSLLKVEDTGMGMTKEQVSRIVNNENQLSMPGTNNELGAGIGMMIVQEFVDHNNGYLTVNSQLGKGTTFVIALPRAEKHNLKVYQ